MPEGFIYRYDSAVRDHDVSPEILPLLEELDRRMVDRPWNFPLMKRALVGLLSFLTSAEGRTDANCRAVDLFVTLSMDGNGWPRWGELPKPFEEVVFDIGGQLHDTFGAPEIAENFESLPEQLLERARKLEVDW